MDDNWRPTQGSDPAAAAAAVGDWRAQLQPEARSRVVNKILETLKKNLPLSVPDGLNELQKIARRLEEKFYTEATNQSDYVRKISLKMVSMETNRQQAPGNAQVIPNQNNPAPALPPQGRNQAQTSAIPLMSQQQSQQPNTSTSVQASSLTNIGQNLPGVNQTSTMQNVSVMPHNTINNGLAQGISQDIYGAQRQMSGRQQQQQSEQLICHQQQMLMKQKLQQNSLMQPHIQQQQSLLQPTKRQSSQQPMMQMLSGLHPGQSTIPQTQPMAMQSATQSGTQQNQLNSVQQSLQSLLQQPQQTVGRQQQQAHPSIHQQPSLQSQQPNIPLQQQQQQLMGHQPNLQQNQPIGQQNGAVEMQEQTQQMLNQQYMPLHQLHQLGSQPNQLQQQSGMQPQSSMQQRLQTSRGMLLQQNNMDPIQAQRGLQEVSSSTSADSTAQTGHADADYWQEEIYQMIKILKDQYFAEVSELFNRLCVKLQHVDSIIPLPIPSEQYDRMKSFKTLLERILQMLQISKSSIQPAMRDKVPQYEKQIITIFNCLRKPVQPQVQQ